MSLELWNTLATFATFVVIAATAIAAIVQLRHIRGGNQIAALNELVETPEFEAARNLVAAELGEKLKDPAFRQQLSSKAAVSNENQPLISNINAVGNFFEGMGVLVKTGLIDRDLVLEMWSLNVAGEWEKLAPATALMRRKSGSTGWDNFEYLAVLSQDWLAAHPNGTYPPGMRRIALKDDWLEADAQPGV
jgi:hypothetical protein